MLGLQVGSLSEDILYWGAPESMTAANMPRPAYVVQTINKTSDLAASVAAALASGALALQQTSNGTDNTAYINDLIATAEGLYESVRIRRPLCDPAQHQGS